MVNVKKKAAVIYSPKNACYLVYSDQARTGSSYIFVSAYRFDAVCHCVINLNKVSLELAHLWIFP